MMRSKLLLVLVSSVARLASAATADGLLVPFSTLPDCAALCGPLFDVQGACVPPAVTTASKSCFCADSRLKDFTTGTAGVESVCGDASCQDTDSLQALETWYQTFCNLVVTSTTAVTSGAAGSTGTGTISPSSPAATVYPTCHWKWVIMLIIMVIAIVGGWIGAALLRKRYVRKRDKEYEMRSAVAWGPHQTQSASGGLGDGVLASGAGDHSKEAGGSTISIPPFSKESKGGWLRKDRT
ncbi:hypothetical protein BJ878DRAFT_413006 [Calycina marina]|uniref:Integral membrane protein n=1 Tax=Calycina marina TaxID=1763456 RepID=A0A9P8CIY6_9HELO|nr:hypothetical protein BJ878DRAFT_413006 [Calycina marina]